MERLTGRYSSGRAFLRNQIIQSSEGINDVVMKLVDKLADYEDLEEQGLLHKAPLKDGTPIWFFMYGFDEETYVANTTYLFGITEYEIGELGKNFWLSEEEAEKKLADMTE